MSVLEARPASLLLKRWSSIESAIHLLSLPEAVSDWWEEGTVESVPPPNHLRVKWWHLNSVFFFFSLLASMSLKFAYSKGKYEFVKLGFQSLEDIFIVVKIIFKVLPESLYRPMGWQNSLHPGFIQRSLIPLKKRVFEDIVGIPIFYLHEIN